MAVMPVCKLPGPEVLPLSYSSMLHAYSMVIYILTELIAVRGRGAGEEAGGSPLNAHCRLPPELIAGLLVGDSMVDNPRQNLHDSVSYRKILLLYFCPGPQIHSQSGDCQKIHKCKNCL